MIIMSEILQGRAELGDLKGETLENIIILFERINKLRTAYGKPMKVNDGYRRPVDTPKNGAKLSKHLIGAAIDIDDDEEGTLWKWTLENLQLLQEIGLWIEDPRWTHGKVGTWMHFQILPPKSGKRIFIPSTAPASAPDIWDGKYDSSLDKPKP